MYQTDTGQRAFLFSRLRGTSNLGVAKTAIAAFDFYLGGVGAFTNCVINLERNIAPSPKARAWSLRGANPLLRNVSYALGKHAFESSKCRPKALACTTGERHQTAASIITVVK